jgi:hypothetical protein
MSGQPFCSRRIPRVRFLSEQSYFCNSIMRTGCYIEAFHGTRHSLLAQTPENLFFMVL